MYNVKWLSNVYFIGVTLMFILIQNNCSYKDQIENKSVFRYNEYRNVTSLAPAFSRNPQNIWPINQLFNGLVQLDENLKIKPEIASSWIISSDGLTYKFMDIPNHQLRKI